MPALVLFGRRWRIASDDFVLEGISYCIIGVIWTVIFSTEISSYPKDCHDTLQFRNLFVAFLVVTVVSLVVNITVTWISSRGTIADGEPRQYIAIPLYGHLIMSVAELIVITKAFLVFFRDSADCVPFMAIWITKAAAVVYALVVFSKLIKFALAFDSLGKQRFPPQSLEDENYRIERAYGVWRDRCKLMKLCCIRESGAENAFEDIAKIFAAFFSDVDLVPSDILTGLLLLNEKNEALSMREDSILLDSAPSWMTLESCRYYFKYAYGGYGCPLVAAFHPCLWPCLLAKHFRCCLCCLSGSADEALGCQMSALQLLSGIKPEDVVHTSFRNRVYQVPFFVALDHERRAVVVSIRGSTSLRDLLTDLNADCEPLLCDNVPPDSLAHRGILKAAKYVHEQLEQRRILEEALQFHPEYNLIVVGHSLGAGVAVLLGLLLRRMYPNIRCYLYGPPGGLLSEDAAKQTEEFVVSLVLGYDWAPRLSLANVERLKKSLIDALMTCNNPKYKVLAKSFFKLFYNPKKRVEEQTGDDSTEQSLMVRGTNMSYDSMHSIRSFLPLYSPGRILHLVRIENERGSCGVKAVWRKASYYSKIIVTPNMVLDHMPPAIQKALEEACATVIPDSQIT